jgi:hypothetical protein
MSTRPGRNFPAAAPAPNDASPPSARLDRCLLGLGVALARCRHQRGVYDLPRHRQIARRCDRPVEPRERPVDRTGGDQRLPEIPERVGVRHRAPGPSPQNRIQLSRSRTRYSVCSGDSPCSAGIRNFRTTSNPGRPPFAGSRFTVRRQGRFSEGVRVDSGNSGARGTMRLAAAAFRQGCRVGRGGPPPGGAGGGAPPTFGRASPPR